MQVDVKIKGRDLRELRKLLSPSDFRRVMRTGCVAAAQIAADAMKEYPPSPIGRPQFPDGFPTLAMQRGFFARLNSGEIEVPYRRGQSPGSQRLNTKWKVRPLRGLAAEAINFTSYGVWVHGDEEQARYHKDTGHKTESSVVEDEIDDMALAFEKVIGKWLK